MFHIIQVYMYIHCTCICACMWCIVNILDISFLLHVCLRVSAYYNLHIEQIHHRAQEVAAWIMKRYNYHLCPFVCTCVHVLL